MSSLTPEALDKAPTRIYQNREVILTTKHGKEKALCLPLRAGLGLNTLPTKEIDTDKLGTFTGEIPRSSNMKETAIKKARLGMKSLNYRLGIATEASFGPHPMAFFLSGSEEVIAFVDEEISLEVTERVFTTETNFGHITAQSIEELDEFLEKVKFPSHGLIVRPNILSKSLLYKTTRMLTGKQQDCRIFKGVTSFAKLKESILESRKVSEDGKALIETDMRAHMNPTRLRVIRKLAIQLARRLRQTCPSCECPGWGFSDIIKGLPCSRCKIPTNLAKLEVYSCQKCDYKDSLPRRDRLESAPPGKCNFCNP